MLKNNNLRYNPLDALALVKKVDPQVASTVLQILHHTALHKFAG